MKINDFDILIVTGVTATGKTSLAVNVAAKLNGEIISADSRQVFRGMSIGTGKDLDDYVVDGKAIPYHLVDICDAGETYSVFQFQQDFLKAYEDIKARKRFPVLSGGTGLYVESVVSRYKLLDVPQNAQLRAELQEKSLEELTRMLSDMKRMHNTTDVDTKQRAIRAIEIETYYINHQVDATEIPEIKPLIVAPSFDRPQVKKRITERLHQRLKEGMVEEAKRLLDEGVEPERLISYGLEYKYLTWYLTGKMDYDTMVERLNIAIHQFSKRQMTWFRRMQRKGTDIHWIDGYLPMKDKVEVVLNLLGK